MDALKEKTKHFDKIEEEFEERDRKEYDEIVKSGHNPERLDELEKRLDARIAR